MNWNLGLGLFAGVVERHLLKITHVRNASSLFAPTVESADVNCQNLVEKWQEVSF